MWYDHLVDDIKIPLVNADRMMFPPFLSLGAMAAYGRGPRYVSAGQDVLYDIRVADNPPIEITTWMKVVAPHVP